MTVTLAPNGDTSNLIEKDGGGQTANVFTLPLPRPAIVALLRELLADPNQTNVTAAPVMVERMRDGVRVHVSRANFMIPWGYLFPILEA